MALVVRLHCTSGHVMRWNAGKQRYTHVSVSERECDLKVDPSMTATVR